MTHKKEIQKAERRRVFTSDFKKEAVQMLLDGHAASTVADRLGLSGTKVLYRWKREQLVQSGPIASSLESRIKDLEAKLRRTERERDILKKALSLFGRSE